jgi:selenocysteine-specific elongation factor
MPIVGTAGHVDHGKSTLVRALTGIDPDRLAEEKARGLTIDLGFAWADIGGHDVGFVDVPGHERFVKNMLAGVGAIDCALLVVAADSGWMPQTEEHASVLDLLEATRGVIALTRVDLVDADTIELATLEILEEIAGTSLEGWPIVPVAATTGMGVEEVAAAIAAVLDGATAPADAPFRMWVDRSFSIAGAGQVVTGTVMSGTVSVGDHLVVSPGGVPMRVRGVQHHERTVDVAVAGSRTALNLTGTHGVERGDLLATPGAAMASTRMIALLRPTRSFEEIPDRGAFHLHIGTADRPAAVRRIARSDGFLITLDTPVAAAAGDRVVLRDSGRRSVVGGGRVLDPDPVRRPSEHHVATLASAVDGSSDERADALVEVHGVIDAARLAAATVGGRAPGAIAAGATLLSNAEVARLATEARALVAGFHEQFPTRPGIPKAELASRLDVATEVVDTIVASDAGLAADEGYARSAGFAHDIGEEAEQRWRLVKETLEASFDVPRMTALGLEPEHLHFLLRRGDLVKIADDLAFTTWQLESLRERVAELPDGFTVSEFRTHFAMSRRQAVPTLEWLDGIGRTRRSGDGRSVRNR